MSLSSVALVPSDFHSSTPVVPSVAVKKTSPLTAMRLVGLEDPVGLMSCIDRGHQLVGQVIAHRHISPFSGIRDHILHHRDENIRE